MGLADDGHLQDTSTVRFGFDAVVAGNVAAGFWTPHVHEPLASVATSLTRWPMVRVAQVDWTHIPARQGHPGMKWQTLLAGWSIMDG